ncbi:chromosome segregation protein SMC [Streptococcaceae bacterium ESL0729]|nr:chromosome segregation protein SMC [Streptococcaceae bacterium ESL0729]
MFLKRIEMVGFKSFADRTKIDFDAGITAIVGPNGSGKSNIAEGLRWVLGEQSAKSLRGTKMPDVIFSGTESRKALNFAEVIVSFDNKDKYLKADQDLTITRRLYRNGDSEFLINGKKVRLKDVHSLFTDTGLGRDSFSIISQGKIEEIFSSKPEDRRLIFEEAAGVLKYKTRKKETEGKLNGTQENIDRLEDIIYELDSQLAPLRAQRDKALKYKQLDGKRMELELSVVVAQIIEEKIKYQARSEAFEEISSLLADLRQKKSVYEGKVASIKDSRRKLNLEREDLQTEVVSLTKLRADYQGKLELFDSQKDASDKSKAELEGRLEEACGKLEGYQGKLEEVEFLLGKNEAEKDTLLSAIKKLEHEEDRYSDDPELVMEELRQAYVSLVDQEASLNNQLVKNDSDVENILRASREQDDSSKELEEAYGQNKIQLISSQKEVDQTSELLAELSDDKKALIQRREEIDRNFQRAQNLMFDKLDQLKSQRAKLESLENIQANHSNYYQGVKAVLNHASKIGGIIGPVADLISFDSKYSTALEVALGGSAQNLIVEDEASAQQAINFLKESKSGRATFLPLTTIKARQLSQNHLDKLRDLAGFVGLALDLIHFQEKIEPALSSLLGTTVVVDTIENASQIARSMDYKFKIVTLDGTILMPGGSYSGGSNRKNSTTFTQAEIKNLKKLLPSLESELKALEQDVKKIQERGQDLLSKLEQNSSSTQDARLKKQEKTLKVEHLMEEKKKLEAQLARLTSKDKSLELNALAEQAESIKIQLESLRLEKVKITQEIENLKKNQTSLKEMKEGLKEKIQTSHLKLTEITSEIKFRLSEKEGLEEMIFDLKEQISNYQKSLTESGKLSLEDRDKYSVRLSEVETRLTACDHKIIQIKFELDDLQGQLDDLDDLSSKNIKAREEYGDSHTRLELELEQSKKYLMDKQLILTDSYQMSFEEAKNQAQDLEDLKLCELELRELEKQIRALGTVNLDAISQYDEVSGRYEFLSTQKDDLLRSKEMLLDTILEMDDEVKIRFKNTFEAVRESFKKTFEQMFDGGQADLELTSDNLLEAGIEIVVQPPGKKLLSLNLMSGGEKSLTALALLFAILKVKTVPFVVLDEVEAALDEANVKRFGNYMTHFDGANQFIVVTHRKGTMAAADSIYGVTMQEFGISKIVSVKLQDIKEDS